MRTHVDPEIIVALLYGLAWFAAGVIYSAYKAITWAENIRSWARHLDLVEAEEAFPDPLAFHTKGSN